MLPLTANFLRHRFSKFGGVQFYVASFEIPPHELESNAGLAGRNGSRFVVNRAGTIISRLTLDVTLDHELQIKMMEIIKISPYFDHCVR